jgi:hypothetical protein
VPAPRGRLAVTRREPVEGVAADRREHPVARAPAAGGHRLDERGLEQRVEPVRRARAADGEAGFGVETPGEHGEPVEQPAGSRRQLVHTGLDGGRDGAMTGRRGRVRAA